MIDLLAGPDTEQLDAMTNALATLAGYEYVDSLNRGIVGRRWLFRYLRGRRTHQLHLVVHGSREWVDRLAFRDQLRRAPNLRARYASLKQELAVRHAADRDAYNAGKQGFIQMAVTMAR